LETKSEPSGFSIRIERLPLSVGQASGLLDLHGVVRDVKFTAERRGDRVVAHITLNQTDFRIKPFRAMMGALRVKAEVLFEVSAPYHRQEAGK
jgi:polyisoprenoid-binding protein YceI